MASLQHQAWKAELSTMRKTKTTKPNLNEKTKTQAQDSSVHCKLLENQTYLNHLCGSNA